uniref:Ubiquitin-like protease family profile domain-containing protein n=1 Tax=Cajanus cajan TaxID=3821 RepID=A0A151RA08_CAJCA|nr:hypothetical protein KK1_039363 [Cajanus cajan]
MKGQKIEINVDPNTGTASGPNSVQFASYLGTLARDKISILVPHWKEVPQATKDLIWQDILEVYQIEDNAILAVREKAKAIQELNDAPHLLSRGGYDLLVTNYSKNELKRLKEEAIQYGASQDVVIDHPPLPPRHKLWVMARTKSSGQMTSKSANQIAEKIVSLDEQASQGSFPYRLISWPRRLVRHISSSKQTQDIPIIHRSKPRNDPICDLREASLTLTYGNPFKVIYLGSLFGVGAGDFVFYITFDDIRELIERQMLNISIIQFWMFYLNQKIEEHGYDDLYGFLEPQYTQKLGNKKEKAISYTSDRIKNSQKQIYLAPYIDQNHWKLLVLCPISNVAVWFCSLHHKPTMHVKHLVKR